MPLPAGIARVLRLRVQQRRLCELELTAVVAAAARLQAEVRALELARDRYADEEAAAAERGELARETLQLGRAYDRRLAASVAVCARRAADAATTAGQARARLRAAHREERRLERLAEIHRERDQVVALRALEHFVDEFLLARHVRLHREGDDAAR